MNGAVVIHQRIRTANHLNTAVNGTATLIDDAQAAAAIHADSLIDGAVIGKRHHAVVQ